MDKTSKRLRIPALFPFILSPLFVWGSEIAGACVHRVRFRETKKRVRFSSSPGNGIFSPPGVIGRLQGSET